MLPPTMLSTFGKLTMERLKWLFMIRLSDNRCWSKNKFQHSLHWICVGFISSDLYIPKWNRWNHQFCYILEVYSTSDFGCQLSNFWWQGMAKWNDHWMASNRSTDASWLSCYWWNNSSSSKTPFENPKFTNTYFRCCHFYIDHFILNWELTAKNSRHYSSLDRLFLA